uniref:Uncharacterized protein n=1 Tax=Arundo donax TaxID=35708 RepID=A0A0A8YGJ6_ARUDO
MLQIMMQADNLRQL